MLEILTILVALSSNYTAPTDPLIGMWENEFEDAFEFREGGFGHDYIKFMESGVQYKWKKNGDMIEFDYPEDIPDRACLFVINDEMLTLSECKIVTSELNYVTVWSGKKVK